MSDVLDLTAAQAAEAVRRGELEPEAIWSAYRERAAADELNAYTWVAGPEAPAVEREAPLAGVPVAIKDLFATEGIPSQAGSKILEDYRPPYTATAVERLQAKGAPVPPPMTSTRSCGSRRRGRRARTATAPDRSAAFRSG